MVYVRIQPSSGIPLGLQIERQLRLAVATGRLAPGEKLPSAREFAATLRVNFHTVRGAFNALERQGLLEVRRGRGTFVAADATRSSQAELRRRVRERMERLFEDLAGTAIEPAEIRAMVEAELKRLAGEEGGDS